MVDSSSLSARAQEIMRRVEAQTAALRNPPPAEAEEPEGGAGRRRRDDDLGDLLDTVEAGVEAAKAHLTTLGRALERIARELGLEIDVFGEEGEEAEQPEAADDDEEAGPRELPPELASHSVMPGGGAPADTPPTPRDSAADDAARLVAIEMAVAGESRESVGRRLREELSIADPRTILEDVFGPEPDRPA